MSNLTKALAVVSLLAPVSAQSLGIGEIELHSALNQNLNAEIRLSLAAGENPAEVSVKLAPPEKFDQAGVVWNYFLSKVKLEPVVQANGSIIVKVSSREALTEPFLDFLLEVTWPQGSMTREFTLLIDPPASYNQPAVPVVEARGYSAEPIEYQERPVRKTRTVPKRAVRAAASDNINPETPTSGEFGPVQKSDTLWSIANQLGQEKNVPAQQMLTALYKANPTAFNNGDIDSLKEGATLKIPETDAILKPTETRTERKTGTKQARPEPTQTAPTNKPLELVAPAEAKIAENAVVTGQGKPQQDAASTAGTGTVSGAEHTGDGKDLELQARIEKLEQQLGMMQQLLALKDQQLAALQNNKPTPAPPAEPSAAVPSTTPAPPAVTEQPAPPPAVATPAPTPEVKPVAPVPPAPQPKPKPTPIPAPAPVVAEEEGLFSSDWYYMVAGGLGAGLLGGLGWLFWRKRKIDERTNTESMFASASQIRLPDSESSLSVPIMDIGSTDEYDVGTVGESSFISDFTPSDFDAFDTDQNEVDPISEADVYLAYGRYQQAEDLIRHAISDQPNRDECKLKLLEIYYASENKDSFARYAQELADAGKQADKPFWKKITDMAKEIVPEMALFGGNPAISAQSGKIDAIAGHAVSAHSSAKVSGLDDVTDLTFMAEDLSDLDIDQELALEDNGLDFDLGSFSKAAKPQDEEAATGIEKIDFDEFASSGAEANSLEADETSDSDPLSAAVLTSLGSNDIDFTDASPAAPEKTASTDAFESFDFNFDTEIAEAQTTPAADEKPQLELETFDFADFDTTDKKPATETTDNLTAELADAESFDFDFDNITTASSPEDGRESDLALDLDSQLKLETFDFSDFDSIAPKSAQAADSTVAGAIETSSEFDFNFDFDAPIVSAKDDNEIELGVSDLTDMDEFETKIDLAKAYIDMGDTDAARLIAEDVLSKGSKEQQQVARDLLDELK